MKLDGRVSSRGDMKEAQLVTSTHIHTYVHAHVHVHTVDDLHVGNVGNGCEGTNRRSEWSAGDLSFIWVHDVINLLCANGGRRVTSRIVLVFR